MEDLLFNGLLYFLKVECTGGEISFMKKYFSLQGILLGKNYVICKIRGLIKTMLTISIKNGLSIGNDLILHIHLYKINDLCPRFEPALKLEIYPCSL